MLDAAARRENLNLDRLRLGNQGSSQRVRAGAEAGAMKSSAANIGSATRSGDGPRFSAGASRGLDRVRSAAKGKSSGDE